MTRIQDVLRNKSILLAASLIFAMLTLGLLMNSEAGSGAIGGGSGDHHGSQKPGKDKVPEQKEPEEPPKLEPCTVMNPATKQFYDLRSLGYVEKTIEDETMIIPQPWMASGYDYNTNFTIGICSSPLSKSDPLQAQDFPGVENKTGVGAYYTVGEGEEKHKLALGLAANEPKFRGKKLILEYEHGDKCENSEAHKSTLLMFTCDRDILSKAKVSFVGSPDNCSYFFEVRTIHACATVAKEEKLGIVWIVILILTAAGLTFFGGNILYRLFKRLGLNQQPAHQLGGN